MKSVELDGQTSCSEACGELTLVALEQHYSRVKELIDLYTVVVARALRIDARYITAAGKNFTVARFSNDEWLVLASALDKLEEG